MGGNALSRPGLRLDKETYFKVVESTLSRLKSIYPEGSILDIKAYSQKPDFGDLDVLIYTKNYDPQTAAEALSAKEYAPNGPVTSLGVCLSHLGFDPEDLFQIDLIYQDVEGFEFASNYFSNNDSGNLFGRIAKSMYTVLRHDGLYFYHREGDYKFREILLTQNYDEALRYIGYDPAKFQQGFETLEDIFKFTVSSEFFNKSIYALENRNYKAKVRDRKRKTYMEFLKWCETAQNIPEYVFPENKEVWLSRIKEYFPKFSIDYAKSISDLEESRKIRQIFSGSWVSEVSGFEGKKLGALMQRIKSQFSTTEEFKSYLLSTTEQDLKQKVLAEMQFIT